MRNIVAGGRGFFGRTIIELMRGEGLAPLVRSHDWPQQRGRTDAKRRTIPILVCRDTGGSGIPHVAPDVTPRMGHGRRNCFRRAARIGAVARFETPSQFGAYRKFFGHLLRSGVAGAATEGGPIDDDLPRVVAVAVDFSASLLRSNVGHSSGSDPSGGSSVVLRSPDRFCVGYHSRAWPHRALALSAGEMNNHR